MRIERLKTAPSFDIDGVSRRFDLSTLETITLPLKYAQDGPRPGIERHMLG